VSTTILAVDDSVTMRKVLEITFSGSNYQVQVVATPDEAATRLRAGGIAAVICDNSLEPSGYDVAKQLKSIAPSVPVLFLPSKQNPYDTAKGEAAGIDDHIVKPFDTQQLVDRVSKLLGVPVQAAAPAPAGAAKPAPAASSGTSTAAMPAASAAASAAKGRTIIGTQSSQASLPPQKVAGFGSTAGRPSAAPAAGPLPASRTSVAPTPSRGVDPLAGAMSAASAKVEGMGLTPQQADAVLALSRELVEKVVWEVVPVLAEALIKEEIARLTK
jgi:CheY-like chemotaxis protein